MKFLITLALLSVALAAPQPRKIFHENFEDFLDIINENAAEITHLMDHYVEFEEFWASVNFMATSKFKGLVYEMESLPEFKAITDFLETHSIDISYFVNLVNDWIETGGPQNDPRSGARHELSGRDFTAFTLDAIAAFPKEKLAALYEQKLAEDEDFKAAIDGILSDEFQELYAKLWENEDFLAEVKILSENGIEVSVLLLELVAVFGQN